MKQFLMMIWNTFSERLCTVAILLINKIEMWTILISRKLFIQVSWKIISWLHILDLQIQLKWTIKNMLISLKTIYLLKLLISIIFIQTLKLVIYPRKQPFFSKPFLKFKVVEVVPEELVEVTSILFKLSLTELLMI